MKEVKHAMGCLPGKVDLRDYKIKKKVCAAEVFPDKFELDNIVKVKNQGQVSSCVAHSSAEIMEYLEGGTVNGKPKLSTNFIYGIRNKLYNSDCYGMYLVEACRTLLKYGTPREELCPGNTEIRDVYEVANKAFADSEAMESAAKHRISSYARVRTASEIKHALVTYNCPILMAIEWYEDNKVVDGIMQKGTIDCGGHALMLRGWDDEKGWLIQNSWGASWGNKGMFYLPFDYKISEAYCFIPKENEEDVVKPATCPVTDIALKFVNTIINIFRKTK